jgi:hypothetical protein
MSIARTLPCVFLVVALAAGAFTPAAHAQASGSVRSGIAAISWQPFRVAELIQKKKHGKEPGQQKHSKDHAKVRTAHVTGHKKHRPYSVARKPTVDSILLRIAPYNLTWV